MIPEEETARRGEPVILTSVNGEQVGTIEWGGVTKPASIYLERGGRVAGVAPRNIKPDPDGKRPVWQSVQSTTTAPPAPVDTSPPETTPARATAACCARAEATPTPTTPNPRASS